MNHTTNTNVCRGAAEDPPPDGKILEAILRQLGEISIAIGKLTTLAGINDRQIQSLAAEVEKVLVPLAEENRHWVDKEVDLRITRPYARALIEIIDRQGAEISALEKSVRAFEYIENCRAVDQQEILNILRRMGIEEIRISRTAEATAELHEIERVRPTLDARKFGRICSVIKRGYHRANDGMLIRPAVVEVWGPTAASV